jgi:ABC-type dipeptide/oligopeptide/nickel transport system permease subunit
MFPLGTDPLGRCVFSEILSATSMSLALALLVTASSAGAGTLAGLAGAYFGGWFDRGLMLITNVALAIPGLVLGLAIVSVLGPGQVNLVVALSASMWVRYARVARQVTRLEMTRGHIEAARAIGGSGWWILTRHLLPAVLDPILVIAPTGIGTALLNASALGFLGLGVPPPAFEWGTMLNSARSYLNTTPRLLLVPGFTIVATVGALTILAEGLQSWRNEPAARTQS